MALPDDVTTFELTFGPYTDAAGEPVFAGMTGKIKPSFPQIRHVESGAVVIDSPIPVEIDGFGMASVELAHTDQAVLSPIGFTYSVVWNVASRKPSPGNKQFAVPASAGAEVDFDLLAPSPDVEGVVVPLTYGKSAYDLAVENGFVGTEGAWLASLVDPEGLADPVVSALVADDASETAVALRAAFDTVAGPTRSAWGHSLVEGTEGGASPWEPLLAGYLGATVNNYGVGGQYSVHVAARQGGKPAIISATGGSIPASGPVAVTMSTDFLDDGASSLGTIAGVRGTLARTAIAVGTFTRASPGTAVPIPGGAPFISDAAVAARGDVVYLWPGRNDLLTNPVEEVVESIGRMIEYLTPKTKRVLILEEPPTVTEITGHANRTALNTLNDAIRSAFPDKWVPIMQWLRTQEAASAAGVVFNAADRANIANAVTPAVFRSDTLHLSTLGNKAVAWRIYQEEVRRGWVLPTQPLPAVSPYATDDFNRADGALGTTPQGEFTWATLQGVGWVVTGNQAGPAASPTASTVSGFAHPTTDGVLSATLAAPLTSSSQLVGLYFRGDGAGTGYVFYRQGGVGAAAAWKIARKTTSAFTDLATGTGAQGTNERLSVRFQGSTITCYIDGVQVAQVADSTYTNTRVGLFMYGTSTTPRLDDFTWAPLT